MLHFLMDTLYVGPIVHGTKVPRLDPKVIRVGRILPQFSHDPTSNLGDRMASIQFFITALTFLYAKKQWQGEFKMM